VRNCFLLLSYGLENIARAGNMGQINLRLDFLFAARRVSWPGQVRRGFRRPTEVGSHFFSFVFFERAGVSLLLGDSGKREHIQNGFALNFQFSCKIVDSNLTHPAFPVPRVVLRSS
jgi:hypothetical protein